MGHINFALDFGDTICLYLHISLSIFFFWRGEKSCHRYVTRAWLHHILKFPYQRVLGGVNKLVHNVCPRVYSSSILIVYCLTSTPIFSTYFICKCINKLFKVRNLIPLFGYFVTVIFHNVRRVLSFERLPIHMFFSWDVVFVFFTKTLC